MHQTIVSQAIGKAFNPINCPFCPDTLNLIRFFVQFFFSTRFNSQISNLLVLLCVVRNSHSQISMLTMDSSVSIGGVERY